MWRARPALAKFKRCPVKNGSGNEYGSNDFTPSLLWIFFQIQAIWWSVSVQSFDKSHIKRSTHWWVIVLQGSWLAGLVRWSDYMEKLIFHVRDLGKPSQAKVRTPVKFREGCVGGRVHGGSLLIYLLVPAGKYWSACPGVWFCSSSKFTLAKTAISFTDWTLKAEIKSSNVILRGGGGNWKSWWLICSSVLDILSNLENRIQQSQDNISTKIQS